MMKRFKYALLAGTFVVASVVAPTFSSDAAAAGKWVKDSKGYWYKTTKGKGNGYAKDEWVDGCYLDSKGYWTYKAKGKWKTDATGKYFQDSKNWSPKSQWQTIDFKTYYFDANGYMAKKEFVKGRYINKNGVATSIKDGKWVKGTGENAGKKAYQFSKTKTLKNGWYRIDGRDYLFSKNGWVVTWRVVKSGGKYYGFDSAGHPKEYTKISAGSKVTGSITFEVTNANKVKAAKDMNTFLGLCTKDGSSRTLYVDKVKKTISNKGGTMYVDNMTLVNYVKKFAKTTSCTVTGLGSVNTLFDALNFSGLGSTNKPYKYTVKIGNSKFTKFVMRANYLIFVVDGKKYQGAYENEKLYILGDVSNAKFVKSLKTAGAFGATKVIKQTDKK